MGDLHDNTDRTAAARAGQAAGKGTGRDRRGAGEARQDGRRDAARRKGQTGRQIPDKAKRDEAAKKIRAMFEPKL